MRKHLSVLLAVTLLVGLLSMPGEGSRPVEAQVSPSSVVDYPPTITTNEERLYACYSLLHQMVDEYNRQAAIAEKDPGKYEDKFRRYSWEYWTPVYSQIAAERNRLKLLIREGTYDDTAWKTLSQSEDFDAVCEELWGNKTAEQDKPTLATSDIFNTLKLVSLDQIIGVDGTDPLEDFTTYTHYYESDDGVTVNNSSQVRLGYPDDTRTRCYKSYFYKDKGSNYFDGDFTHRFRVTWTSVETYCVWETWMLANTVEDGKEMVDGSEDGLWTYFSSSHGGSESVTYLRELNGGSFTTDSYTGSYTPEKFYTIVRDEGVGTYGELTMYICEDNYYGESSPSPDLKDTLVVTLTEKQDFRYVYMLNSYDTDTCPSSRIYDAYINDLDLDAAVASGTPPTVVTLAANTVEDTTANMRGNVTSINNTAIEARGFGWDTTSRSEPDEDTSPSASSYTNSWTQSGNYSTGVFNYSGATFSPATTYYFRAAANNTDGKWGWGDELSFLTKPAAPTNVTATDGTYTDKVVVNWTLSAGNVTGYKVYRDGDLIQTVGNVSGYEDTGADAPTITPGTAAASDGTSTLNITLSLSGESGNNGTTHTYKVRAYNDTGDSDDSSTDTGYRGTTTLTYQWYRSSGDADSGYSSLAGATTDPYVDTTAPAPTITPGTSAATDGTSTLNITLSLSGESGNNGAGRYYKCEVSMSGASSQNSTSNRGYRGTTTLTYQWYRSSGDADSGYSQLAGATTDPYVDTTAPAPTVTPGTGAATDGTSSTNVTLSVSGESGNNGAGRYYKCEVSMVGAASQNSSSNRGYRGTTTLTYQWYRSSGDADSGYSSLGGATTDPYDDTTAPAPTIDGGNATASDGTSPDYVTLSCNETSSNGDGRYWKCEVSMSGAASQNSSSNRGYRGTTTLTYQWWRSSGDAPSGYSTIPGGTTDPYNDTGGVEDPDGRYYLVTTSMVGATSQNSSADRGYEQAADEPTVVTLNASNIACTTATLSGNITDVTGGNATTRGFQYGLSTGNYSWSTNETGNFGLGVYSLNITSLSQNTTYYVRAFAVNTEGTGYGNETNFVTLEASLPIVTSSAATAIDSDGATLHGNITDTGCTGVTVSIRGFEWGTSTGNYTSNWTQAGSYGTGTYNRAITGLSANTTYFWRALATNPVGTNYSSERSFNTTAASTGNGDTTTNTTTTVTTTSVVSFSLTGDEVGLLEVLILLGFLICAIWKKRWIRVILSLGILTWGIFSTQFDIKVGMPIVAVGILLFFLGLFNVYRARKQAQAEPQPEM